MAKGWKATTNIQFGAEDGTVSYFKPGDVVEGLSKEQMAELWEAGALEETMVADSESAKAPESSTAPATVVEGSSKPVTEGGSTEGEPAA